MAGRKVGGGAAAAAKAAEEAQEFCDAETKPPRGCTNITCKRKHKAGRPGKGLFTEEIEGSDEKEEGEERGKKKKMKECKEEEEEGEEEKDAAADDHKKDAKGDDGSKEPQTPLADGEKEEGGEVKDAKAEGGGENEDGYRTPDAEPEPQTEEEGDTLVAVAEGEEGGEEEEEKEEEEGEEAEEGSKAFIKKLMKKLEAKTKDKAYKLPLPTSERDESVRYIGMSRIVKSEAALALFKKERMEQASTQCPPGFEARWSNSKNRTYYVEKATGKTLWNLPGSGGAPSSGGGGTPRGGFN